MTTAGILTLSCPDRPGLVHAVSGFLVDVPANIVESHQFEDPRHGRFFMRIRFDLLEAGVSVAEVRDGFEPVAVEHAMAWNIVDAETPTDAVVTRPPRKLVLKRGRIVARDGKALVAAP